LERKERGTQRKCKGKLTLKGHNKKGQNYRGSWENNKYLSFSEGKRGGYGFCTNPTTNNTERL
jgi:hypothetical protein